MTSQPKQPTSTPAATPATSGVPQHISAVAATQDALFAGVAEQISELESRIAALEIFVVDHCHGLPGQFNRQTTSASDPHDGIHEADPEDR